MIYIDGDKEVIECQGTPATIVAEFGTIMAVVYGEISKVIGEQGSIELMLETIKATIEFKKISITDILADIRNMKGVRQCSEN